MECPHRRAGSPGYPGASLDELVRGTVEETLNTLLDAEAHRLCGAECYERSEDRKIYLFTGTDPGGENVAIVSGEPNRGKAIVFCELCELCGWGSSRLHELENV